MPLCEKSRLVRKSKPCQDFSWLKTRGSGIPDALKERLFSSFFTSKSDGLGMGLAICRTILKGFGGSITCRNRPERGAAFYVQLPLAT
jgi:C4-dicarboxylate-specific signal transduction histidine kinase